MSPDNEITLIEIPTKKKNNKGLGNSDEGGCQGKTCTDPDNPGRGGRPGR